MFQLDMKSGKSIYEQVIDNIKELIMTDVLAENTRLPSVRTLSRQLTINPNTVQKAFKELEREGYIFTVSGKGTFVGPKSGIKAEPARVKSALADVISAFKELLYLGLSPEEARDMSVSAIDALIGSVRKEKEL